MKKTTKVITALALTAAVGFAAGSYLANKQTLRAFANKTREVGITNEVSRVESWDRLEQLLVKGCNKQALEFVRTEQTSALLAIKYQTDASIDLMNKVKERNPEIARRVDSASKTNTHSISTCK